jgi:twinkle protein
MIDWNEIDFKGKSSGQIKVKCPACIDSRSNKADTSLSINISKGIGKCHYCEEVTIKDPKKKEQKDYKYPVQEWQNYTKLSDNMVKWFNSRKITQNTLIKAKVTEEVYYQPALKKEVNNIVFNYFEGKTLINKKYRSGDKKFTQSSGTKNIFYGINDIIDCKEVYIVEGEIDKLSLMEIGIDNCISVPNGANDNDDVWVNCEDYFKGVETFYIATDKDEKGNTVAEKIAQRLGRWRCRRIIFNGKDANEDLVSGCLEQSLMNIQSYPVSGTLKVSDFKSDIFDLYDNGLPNVVAPVGNGLDRLVGCFSTMMGHLVVCTGIPSHGKSTFMEWYVLNLLAENDLKASFFSPEHMPFALHQSTFIQKFYGKTFFDNYDKNRVTKQDIKDYIEWADEKIYLTCPENGSAATWDFIFDAFKQQIYSYGVNVFVIDAFNKVLFDKSGNKKDNIDEVLTRLTSFSQLNNVLVFLVAHPTKMYKDEKTGETSIPSLYDVSGSADFRNQTHDGFCVHRTFGDDPRTSFINLKTKYSFQGEIGKVVDFVWHPSGRYYSPFENYTIKPLIDFTKNQSKLEFDTVNGYPSIWD